MQAVDPNVRRRCCSYLETFSTRKIFKSIIKEAGGLVVHGPGGLTHQWQAIDRGYGRQFSHEVMVAQDEDCDTDPVLYQQFEDGTLTASDRRIKMTDWVGRAVAKVNSKMEVLEKYAGHGGLLITADGSDDDKIKLEGLPKDYEYSFNHVEPDEWINQFNTE